MKRQEVITFLKENKKFSLLWSSQILSQITLNMINFVMATRIYEKTGSTLAVSFLWVFFYLPAFLLGPFSGLFVDLWSLRSTLLVTNFLQGVTMLLFLFVGDKVYLIYSIVFVFSLLNQFYFPAEAASLPWLVKKKNLPLANSLFMMTAQTSLIIGLGVSGILMRFFGKNNPVIISAMALFIAAVAVYYLPKEERAKRKFNINNFSKFWSQLGFGYSFIRSNKIVLFPILLTIFTQVLLVSLAVTIPSFASNLLNIDLQDAGLLMVVPLGVGALLGTLSLSKYFKNVRKKILMKKGLTGAFFIFMFFALILPLLGPYKVYFTVLSMFALGYCGFFIAVPNQTLLQENTPSALRGRVFGALGFLSTLVTLPFLIFSATIVDLLGTGLFMFIAGIIVFVILLMMDKAEAIIMAEKVENGRDG